MLAFSLPPSANAAIAINSSFSSDSFSIIQISDTQYLSAKYPDLFLGLTNWIVNYSVGTNLQMVIHTGDIVDASNGTQWQYANKSMSVLRNANIPYCWVAGNHDQFGNALGGSCGNPNLSWGGNRLLSFNAADKRSQDYWVDDSFDSKNTAVKFNYNQYPFLIIGLEYHANAAVMAWAKDLLDKSAGSNVIIATHSYLNDTNGYGVYGDYSWETNLKKLLNEYPNVFLTLSGHDDYDDQVGANMTRVGNREEIFFDRQDIDDQKGAASARVYMFNLTSMRVEASTYLVHENSLLNDSFNKFDFNIALQKDGVNNIFPYSYFWVGPDYNSHVSFSENCRASSIQRAGSKWLFGNLTLNGSTSNLIVTSSVNLKISYYDSNDRITCFVNGNGIVAISLERIPASVIIGNEPSYDRWTYADNTITIESTTGLIDIQCDQPSSYSMSTIPIIPQSTLTTIAQQKSVTTEESAIMPSFKATAHPTPSPTVSQEAISRPSPTVDMATAAPTENQSIAKTMILPFALIFIPFLFLAILITIGRTRSKYIKKIVAFKEKDT